MSASVKKMEVNTSFIAGLACGVCLGLSLFAFRRLYRLPAPAQAESAIAKNGKSTKKEALQVFNDNEGEYKMVLVVRNDLKMGKGKVAAQCAHAAVGAYISARKKDKEALSKWAYTGQAKIALKVESEEELVQVYDNARNAGLVASLIRDAGRTQISPNTKTVVGIGPASKSAIDRVTGHLKLY